MDMEILTPAGVTKGNEWFTAGTVVLETSVRMNYPVLKVYWNTFLTALCTKPIIKCHEMLLKLKISFAYAAVTGKRPEFAQGHLVYVHETCGKNALARPARFNHARSLHSPTLYSGISGNTQWRVSQYPTLHFNIPLLLFTTSLHSRTKLRPHCYLTRARTPT